MELTQLAKKLSARGFIPVICENAAEAAAKMLEIIPANESVGTGGSVTLAQLGVKEMLASAPRCLLRDIISFL